MALCVCFFQIRDGYLSYQYGNTSVRILDTKVNNSLQIFLNFILFNISSLFNISYHILPLFYFYFILPYIFIFHFSNISYLYLFIFFFGVSLLTNFSTKFQVNVSLLTNFSTKFQVNVSLLTNFSTKFQVNDGKWHNVEVKWMKGEVWVDLDFGDYEFTERSDHQIGGLYIDKVSVGGVDPADKLEVNYFKGCIKVMMWT